MIAANNQLPDIGYTVAIENIFYIFFTLCLLAIVSAFMGEKPRLAENKQAALVLNHSVKGVYVVAIFTTLLLYWWHYCR